MASAIAAHWAAYGCCPYTTLGIRSSAAPEEVRTAHRRAALRTHPDKPGGSNEAFNAVQYAYEALLAQRPDLHTGAAAAPAWEGAEDARCAAHSAAAAAWGAAAPGAAGAAGGLFSPQQWQQNASAAFDPWGASTQATFDPWDSASLDAATEFDPYGSASGSTFDPWSTAAVSREGELELAAELPAKRRRLVSDLRQELFPPEAEELNWRRKEAGVERRRGAGGAKGKGSAPPDGRGKTLPHLGVYGFRPETGSDDEVESAVTPGAPPHCAVGGKGGGRGRGAKDEKQFYCSRHKRLRFESALEDDGEGNPVCKFGQDCP